MNTSFITLIHIVRVFRKLLWKKAVHSSSIFPKIVKIFGKTRQLSNVCRIAFYWACVTSDSVLSSAAVVWRSVTLRNISGYVPILYPLKTPENQRFSRVFSGYETGILVKNWLKGFEESCFPVIVAKVLGTAFW